MKLYVCYGTFGTPARHACAKAHRALLDAGHSPAVVKTYGCFSTDPLWPGRRTVEHLTGNYKVPTLVLDDGTVIDESSNIAAWAQRNPGQTTDPAELRAPPAKRQAPASTETTALPFDESSPDTTASDSSPRKRACPTVTGERQTEVP